jgi:hypothetical protein
MQAMRLIVETDEHGQILNLPRLSPRVRLEAIFLELDELGAGGRYDPLSTIPGQGRLTGDVEASPADWAPPSPCRLGEFQAPVDDWRILANEPDRPR